MHLVDQMGSYMTRGGDSSSTMMGGKTMHGGGDSSGTMMGGTPGGHVHFARDIYQLITVR